LGSLDINGKSGKTKRTLEGESALDDRIKDNRPPKKHQPRGLPILHEDKEIIVAEKPSGLLTIGTSHWTNIISTKIQLSKQKGYN
jgi:23S rRNA-/tRNA-specific pseudouridylate synthase